MGKETNNITHYHDAVFLFGRSLKFLDRKYENDNDKDYDVLYFTNIMS